MNAKAALMVGVLAVVGVVGYLFISGGNAPGSGGGAIPTPTYIQQKPHVVGSSTTPVDSPAVTPTKSKDETSAVIAAVKAGLITAHGKVGADMTVTVSSIQGKYARGMTSEKGGGGVWFAAKIQDAWQLVWDGNGVITCTALAKYPGFPVDMIPQCYADDANMMITRTPSE